MCICVLHIDAVILFKTYLMYAELTTIKTSISYFVQQFLRLDIQITNVSDCLTNIYLLFSDNNTIAVSPEKVLDMLCGILGAIYSYKHNLSALQMIKSRLIYALQCEKLVEDICLFCINDNIEMLNEDEVEFYNNNKIYYKHAVFLEDAITQAIKSVALCKSKHDSLRCIFYKWCVTDENMLHTYDIRTSFNTAEQINVKEQIDFALHSCHFFE